MASARKPAGVQEEGAKRKREAEEEKESEVQGSEGTKRCELGAHVETTGEGGEPAEGCNKGRAEGTTAVDKMTGVREGWIGQGSAPHRTCAPRGRGETLEKRKRGQETKTKQEKTRHPPLESRGGYRDDNP